MPRIHELPAGTSSYIHSRLLLSVQAPDTYNISPVFKATFTSIIGDEVAVWGFLSRLKEKWAKLVLTSTPSPNDSPTLTVTAECQLVETPKVTVADGLSVATNVLLLVRLAEAVSNCSLCRGYGLRLSTPRPEDLPKGYIHIDRCDHCNIYKANSIAAATLGDGHRVWGKTPLCNWICKPHDAELEEAYWEAQGQGESKQTLAERNKKLTELLEEGVRLMSRSIVFSKAANDWIRKCDATGI